MVCDVDYLDNFRDVFRKMRKNSGFTIQRLSEVSGVSSSTISRIESPRKYRPSLDVLLLLGDSMNVDLVGLFSKCMQSKEEKVKALIKEINVILEKCEYYRLPHFQKRVKSMYEEYIVIPTSGTNRLKLLDLWLEGLIKTRLNKDYLCAQSIFLTALDINEEDIRAYLKNLSEVEIHIALSYVISLMFQGRNELAMGILEKMQKYKLGEIDDFLYIKISFNLCAIYKKKKKYKHALDVVEKAIEYSNKNFIKIKYGNLLLKRAMILYEQGILGAEDEVRKALVVVSAENKNLNLQLIKKNLKNRYCFEF